MSIAILILLIVNLVFTWSNLVMSASVQAMSKAILGFIMGTSINNEEATSVQVHDTDPS